MKSNICKAIIGMACALALVVAATALVSCVDTSPPDGTETGTWYVKVTNDFTPTPNTSATDNTTAVTITGITIGDGDAVGGYPSTTGTVDTVEKTGLSIASEESSEAGSYKTTSAATVLGGVDNRGKTATFSFAGNVSTGEKGYCSLRGPTWE